MKLRDSVIIVTGSATGLGSAIIKQVAAKGARGVINYPMSETDAREPAAVCDYLGVESIVCQADVAVDVAGVVDHHGTTSVMHTALRLWANTRS